MRLTVSFRNELWNHVHLWRLFIVYLFLERLLIHHELRPPNEKVKSTRNLTYNKFSDHPPRGFLQNTYWRVIAVCSLYTQKQLRSSWPNIYLAYCYCFTYFFLSGHFSIITDVVVVDFFSSGKIGTSIVDPTNHFAYLMRDLLKFNQVLCETRALKKNLISK